MNVRRQVLVCGFGLAAVFADGLAVWTLYRADPVSFAVLHLLAVGCVLIAVSRARGEPWDRAVLEGLVTLAVPLVGATAAGLILLLGAATKNVWRISEVRLRTLLRSEQPAEAWELNRALEEEVAGAGFIELLRSRDLGRIEEAFVQLTRRGEGSAIPAVRRAMQDPEPEIRLRARVLLVMYQDRAVQELLRAREAARRAPEDPEPCKRAARACLMLSRLATEAETAANFLARAVTWLSTAHRLAPEDGQVLLDLGMARLAAGDPANARHEFRKLLRKDPEDLRGRLGCAEACYLLRDVEGLQSDCEAILARAKRGTPEHSTAEFFLRQAEGGL